MKEVKNLYGLSFNRWTVIGKHQRVEQKTSGVYKTMWPCRCSCGTERLVHASTLKSGESKSCGCLKQELATRRGTKHGFSKTQAYASWVGARRRCTDETCEAYENYGGRGIQMCDRWLDDFEAFLQDMGDRPEGYTLDRIDVNGNYEPENCRLVTMTTQIVNRRKTRRNTSGRVGVSWYQNAWNVKITVDGRVINLGRHTDFDTACMVRDCAEHKYFGKILHSKAEVR